MPVNALIGTDIINSEKLDIDSGSHISFTMHERWQWHWWQLWFIGLPQMRSNANTSPPAFTSGCCLLGPTTVGIKFKYEAPRAALLVHR